MSYVIKPDLTNLDKSNADSNTTNHNQVIMEVRFNCFYTALERDTKVTNSPSRFVQQTMEGLWTSSHIYHQSIEISTDNLQLHVFKDQWSAAD